MGMEPTSRGSPRGSAVSFRKISKPLMEKKRRARINVSLQQLKSLLEKHYSHQIRKRKLEKADILELSVKYMKTLQSSLQGLWPVPSGAEYPSGFRGCLPGVSQLLRRAEDGSGGPRCPLTPQRSGGSTTDSASPGPDAPAPHRPCVPAASAPGPATGHSHSPSPRFLLPRGLPGSTSVPAPQPTPHRRAESPGPGLRVWRPWSPSAAAQRGPLAARRIAAPPRSIQVATGARFPAAQSAGAGFPPAQSTLGLAPPPPNPHPLSHFAAQPAPQDLLSSFSSFPVRGGTAHPDVPPSPSPGHPAPDA